MSFPSGNSGQTKEISGIQMDYTTNLSVASTKFGCYLYKVVLISRLLTFREQKGGDVDGRRDRILR